MISNLYLQKIAILLFFIMFVYSGFNKIPNFTKLVSGLAKKTHLPFPINELGMIGVILLETIGALVVVYYFLIGENKYISKEVVKYIVSLFILFMIVVTPLYHPPTDKIIPFLANVTTTGGFLLIYNLL
uniref:DoxX family protein n=1 Tax=viral metagenome TaxID=1070528 RepID=A0A6C0FE01_9ZZZZ|tara:strand:+ start:4280 stop:4666 length:387 start_codon:yes stop_codon:yes gene_type:complete